jgi:putative ABC transport system permease protein
MYLGRRDLVVAKGRFALVGTVIALVALLATMLSGLATGLVDDGISGLRALPLTHLAFQDGADESFSRSILTPDALDTFTSLPGVEATPVGLSFFNAKSDRGTSIDIALLGVAPDGFLARAPDAAARDHRLDGALVLSDDLRDEAAVGDRFTIVGTDRALPVVGFTAGGTYGHVPLAYTSLDTWRQVLYGNDARGRFSAIALRVHGTADLRAADAKAGTDTVTKRTAFNGSPGFSAETATMTLIRGFLLVISALVVGAFFTVWTVQRTRQIGLLKALGASSAYVVRDALGQLAVVLLVAVSIGTAIGLVLGGFVGSDVPFHLAAGSVAASAITLTVVGMAGSLVALRRLTRVDPLTSLGAEQ